MFDQTRYDRTLPKSINDRRRQETHFLSYEAYISTQEFNALRARKLSKPAPKARAVSQAELGLRIRSREAANRALLRRLFDAELAGYDAALAALAPSEDQILAENELRAAGIRADKNAETRHFCAQKRAQQLENNCDELRILKHEMHAKASRLTLDYQVQAKKERNEKERKIELQVDLMVVADHRKFVSEQQANFALKKCEIQRKKCEIEAEIDLKSQLRVRQQAERLIEAQKAQELNAQRKVLDQLENDVIFEQKMANRKNLECLIAVENAKKAVENANQIVEERTQNDEINAEIRQQALENLAQKELLRDQQAVYCELVNYRKEVVRKENLVIDNIYYQQIKNGVGAENLRNENERARDRKISQICFEYNKGVENRNQSEIQQNQQQKLLENQQHLQDLQILEEERLINYQKQVDQQLEYVTFLNFQETEAAAKANSLRREDEKILEFQQKKLDFEAVQQQNFAEKLRKNISEIVHNFAPPETKRGALKRRQWYNV
ncbi:hypothetical protein SS50377_22963 [Spironucleus salmonicida]|uniref:Trichohyalin-plectin-homology domain-containing protein n=1 Tax=Spironucleus salmonicida TaxID=348837 RepID=V6LWA4_9EUKA|nr:hypothetical protein SS50377_22963 [Spironucleus salmonicida]|eukprot:EST47991.1 hypothetical protein SS50377_11909 [Spironucleus salmonicida]